MPGAHYKNDRRHQARYTIAPDKVVIGQIERKQADENIQGELLDLSSCGSKVSLRTNLTFSEKVNFRILVPEVSIDISVHAIVAWVRSIGNDDWHVGCYFTTRIPDEIFDQLGVAGYIDRRRGRRWKVSISGVARWELSSQAYPVEIVDYSGRGFCLLSGRAGIVGSMVCFEFHDMDGAIQTIFGQVKWQTCSDGQYRQGCEFKGISTCSKGVELLHDLSTVVTPT